MQALECGVSSYIGCKLEFTTHLLEGTPNSYRGYRLCEHYSGTPWLSF